MIGLNEKLPLGFPLLLKTSDSLFLKLPIDIRDHIINYLLPAAKTIPFQCPLGNHRIHYVGSHGRWQCGQGLGWNCLRNKKDRPLEIMRVNPQIYEDSRRLLYNRNFHIEIGDELFYFVNLTLADKDRFGHFPVSDIKCLSINLEITFGVEAVQKTLDVLSWVCRIMARSRRIRRLEIWLWVAGGPQHTPISTSDIKTYLSPFGILHNVQHASIGLQRLDYGITSEVKPEIKKTRPSLELEPVLRLLVHESDSFSRDGPAVVDLSSNSCAEYLIEQLRKDELEYGLDETWV